MKQRFIWLISAGALLCALSFSACPAEAEDEGDTNPPPAVSLAGGRGELELTLNNGELYYLDFATGTEVTGADNGRHGNVQGLRF
jgi:hypothetical protein